jgi:hypothetical protein
MAETNCRYVDLLKEKVAKSSPLVEVAEVISLPAGLGLIAEVAESIEAGLA